MKITITFLIFFYVVFYSCSAFSQHWLERKAEAWNRYLIMQEKSGSWYEKDVLWDMQGTSNYLECEKSVTEEFDSFFDVFFKVNKNGEAVDIEWYPDTNDGGCISEFLKNYSFPSPPETVALWLQIYPREI